MKKYLTFLDTFKKIFYSPFHANIFLKFILVFTLSSLFNSCKNETIKDEQFDYQSKIEEINSKVEESFKNGSIISEDLYVYVLKSGDLLEFYCNLDYDGEGWPNRGHAYYFFKNKLIGSSSFPCDGCIKEDIISKLKNMKIKKVKVPFETASDTILCFDNLDDELRLISNEKIEYAKKLKSKNEIQDKLSYGEIRGSIISGTKQEVENFLGQPDGDMSGLEYAQDVLRFKRLGIVWMERLTEYKVWVYNSPDNTGKELLVIFHCDIGGYNCKVMKVIYSENITDFRDLYN
jgi:hypothetical protein